MDYNIEEQYDKIYRYCYMHVRHRQTAEDLTQEAFLRFLENKSYREVGKCLAYLYTIARNLCTDYYRRNKEEALPDEYEQLLSPSAEDKSGEAYLIDTLDLREAVQQLEIEEQELLVWRYVNDVSVTDIAKILGISRFAVHRKLKSVLGRLEDIMGKGREH